MNVSRLAFCAVLWAVGAPCHGQKIVYAVKAGTLDSIRGNSFTTGDATGKRTFTAVPGKTEAKVFARMAIKDIPIGAPVVVEAYGGEVDLPPGAVPNTVLSSTLPFRYRAGAKLTRWDLTAFLFEPPKEETEIRGRTTTADGKMTPLVRIVGTLLSHDPLLVSARPTAKCVFEAPVALDVEDGKSDLPNLQVGGETVAAKNGEALADLGSDPSRAGDKPKIAVMIDERFPQIAAKVYFFRTQPLDQLKGLPRK